MAVEKIKHSLELDERMDLHEKGWKAQRILLILFILFLTAAAIGFFGNGPVSIKKAADDTNSIEFEKYTRYESHMKLKIEAGEAEGVAKVQFPQEYFNNFQIEKITPEPNDTEVENGNQIFYFSSKGNLSIDFFLKSNNIGSVNSNIKVNNSTFTLSHYIYP